MTVQVYRETIAHVVDALKEFRAAVGEVEQFHVALRLHHQIRCVERAKCKTAKLKDLELAVATVHQAKDALIETEMLGMVIRQQQADASLQQMSFAGEYR